MTNSDVGSYGAEINFWYITSAINVSHLFVASEKQMKLVCRESSEEHLQPFKEKLEEFFQKGNHIWKKNWLPDSPVVYKVMHNVSCIKYLFPLKIPVDYVPNEPNICSYMLIYVIQILDITCQR